MFGYTSNEAAERCVEYYKENNIDYIFRDTFPAIAVKLAIENTRRGEPSFVGVFGQVDHDKHASDLTYFFGLHPIANMTADDKLMDAYYPRMIKQFITSGRPELGIYIVRRMVSIEECYGQNQQLHSDSLLNIDTFIEYTHIRRLTCIHFDQNRRIHSNNDHRIGRQRLAYMDIVHSRHIVDFHFQFHYIDNECNDVREDDASVQERSLRNGFLVCFPHNQRKRRLIRFLQIAFDRNNNGLRDRYSCKLNTISIIRMSLGNLRKHSFASDAVAGRQGRSTKNG
jgi:hypothetical protein